ncbi:unnamed protein product [Colias eurytheme]|nr:unnamed protein product [Colias eurytheme]
MKSTLRPNKIQTDAEPEFQLKLENRFAALETTDDIDQRLEQTVDILRREGAAFFKRLRTGRKSKLSEGTLELMKQRRENPPLTLSEQRALNKRISKMVRYDLRCSNTIAIKKAIEENRGSKVFARKLNRSHLTKLTTSMGSVVTSKPEILSEVEDFYSRLYASHAPQPESICSQDPRATLTRHYTEDLPDISLHEIELALGQLKNGKASGEDGITTELLKAEWRRTAEDRAKWRALGEAYVQQWTDKG